MGPTNSIPYYASPLIIIWNGRLARTYAVFTTQKPLTDGAAGSQGKPSNGDVKREKSPAQRGSTWTCACTCILCLSSLRRFTFRVKKLSQTISRQKFSSPCHPCWELPPAEFFLLMYTRFDLESNNLTVRSERENKAKVSTLVYSICSSLRKKQAINQTAKFMAIWLFWQLVVDAMW